MEENVVLEGENVVLEEQKPKSYRHWIILLYKDSSSYNFDDVMKIIKSHKYYAYIEHQPESDETKAHFHVILSFDNATKKSTLSNKLNVPQNFINEIKNFRSMCRYLTHIDYEDKTQYDIKDVKISKCFERKFKKCFDDLETEQDMMNNIYLFIDKLNEQKESYYENIRYLITYVNNNCYDTVYKRYRNEFLEYLKQGIRY